MTNAPELLPCPFCGGVPRLDLEKVTHCQLHGDPSQAVRVYCYHACNARPSVIGGDVYNGGIDKAKADVANQWNTRVDISKAAIAAAYKVAATEITRKQMDSNSSEWESEWGSGNNSAVIGCAATIRALTPAAALAALEAVKREARKEGFRAGFEQATICDFDDWLDAWAISKLNTAQEDDA